MRKNFLDISKEDKWYEVALYMLIATIFAIWFRQIYLHEVAQYFSIYYHGKPLINNNDGYYFAEGARDILAGFHQKGDLSPVDYPLSKLTAFLVRVLHIDIDTLIFYMPGVVGALLAVPLVLLGHELKNAFMGFLAALLAPITWSYYHRTMYGYYDTDMLVIVLPLFAIWGIVKAVKSKNTHTYWIGPLFIAMSIAWHNGLFMVSNAIVAMTLLYILIFDRDKKSFLFFAFLLVSVMSFGFWIQVALLGVLTLLFWRSSAVLERYFWHFFAGITGLYAIFGGWQWIEMLINNPYFHHGKSVEEEGLHFYAVVNTVREAGHISWDTVIHRISGSYAGFILGALGYLLLLIRYPLLLISLPMVGLGLYAHFGGLRFTIFSVPFFALGDAYVAVLVGRIIAKFLDSAAARFVSFALPLLFIAALIYPNYEHAKRYIVPTVLTPPEIDALHKLHDIASREDYVLTWWDYGYPVRYYADVKTLVDGGKHTGDVNFPVSYALTTTNQIASKNMAVLDVYFTEKFLIDSTLKGTYIEAMMHYYGIKEPNTFLDYIQKPIKLPKIKEKIFYYLPLRMLEIFPTIAKFSQIDLRTGKSNAEHFFFVATSIRKEGDLIVLNNMMAIAQSKGELLLNRNRLHIHRIAQIVMDKNGYAHVQEDVLYPQGPVNVIVLPQFGKILVVDDAFYDSVYFQLFFFDRYDPDIFEPVITNPYVKIYRLK